VRQIESAALEKLRRLVLARVGDPVAAGYVG
jgi:DNA-directed RNA polymerase sigma subunit (sigma70/sigma32)